jgi:hypothetical protein
LLIVSCDGGGSLRAVRYTFTFEDGPQFTGTDSTASHTYLSPLPRTYTITLTVLDALDRTDTDSWDESLP